MKRILYTIYNTEPLNFSEKSGDATLYTTKRYIPGTTIRGALAEQYIAKNHLGTTAHENPDFFKFLLSGKVRYLPAYPIGDSTMRENNVFLLPLSMMRSKDGKTLMDISGSGAPQAGFKKLQGFVVKDGDELHSVDVNTQIALHMARNTSDDSRREGHSMDGNLFNYEYIEAGQWFQGAIIADDDVDVARFLHDSFKNKLQADGIVEVYLGKSRKTQYGACQLKWYDEETILSKPIDPTQPTYLYCYTPYIPYEEWQRVDTVAKDLCKMIEEKLGKQDVALFPQGDEALKIFAANEEIKGYLAVWQARREQRMAISAGSLFPIDISGLTEKDITDLEALLYGGFGYRCEEGYGQLRLWQPLHDPKPPTALVKSSNNDTISISSSVRKAAREIVHQRILEEIKNQAFTDAEDFDAKAVGKHILTRLEMLIEEKDSLDGTKRGIDTMKKQATDNLIRLTHNGRTFLTALQDDGETAPWNQDWSERIGLTADKRKKLEQDLDKEVFTLSRDKKYVTYWTWYIRHASKLMDDKGGEA